LAAQLGTACHVATAASSATAAMYVTVAQRLPLRSEDPVQRRVDGAATYSKSDLISPLAQPPEGGFRGVVW